MKCAYCATPNRDVRRFCSRCGVMLGWACARCAFFNHLSEQHCGGCGVPQTGTAPSHAPTAVSDATTATSPPPAGRTAIIKDEIQHFLKEQAAGPVPSGRQAPVSQDDIDTLFRR